MRFANTMPGVAVVGDAGDIADFSGQTASPRAGNVCDAVCVVGDGYARHDAAVSV